MEPVLDLVTIDLERLRARLPDDFTARFQLEELLGRGAQGLVLRALQHPLMRPVVITLLLEVAPRPSGVSSPRGRCSRACVIPRWCASTISARCSILSTSRSSTYPGRPSRDAPSVRWISPARQTLTELEPRIASCTNWMRVWRVKGFCRSGAEDSLTPCWLTRSSVYPDM